SHTCTEFLSCSVMRNHIIGPLWIWLQSNCSQSPRAALFKRSGATSTAPHMDNQMASLVRSVIERCRGSWLVCKRYTEARPLRSGCGVKASAIESLPRAHPAFPERSHSPSLSPSRVPPHPSTLLRHTVDM